MRECQCLPWDMLRNDTQFDYELCDSGGNGCFWATMGDSLENGVMDSECFCLGLDSSYLNAYSLCPKMDFCSIYIFVSIISKLWLKIYEGFL